MQFDILTLFPEMFYGVLNSSILKRAQEKGLLSVNLVNIRDYSTDRHRCVDDYPFGGGPGMVLCAEPVVTAVENTLGQSFGDQVSSLPEGTRLILLSPQGPPFQQEKAFELARCSRLVLICGHYEGMDERVRLLLKPEEVSIGDYILTGGEIPAMVVLDAVTRLIPGVLGESEGGSEESFYSGLLEFPQYTRPRVFRDLEVPEVLISGDHGRINEWRRKQSLLRTWERRKDLLEKADLSAADQQRLNEALRK
ncbi:MAG: tRNA (guanosine(37)-N1)-methyltransferase TrmD [Syntrophomonadaceae bacterium]|nr:tRNA (guanosine(37)-N1)-methyltransferase TrmD [Syntrophomonadaceae bacterium]